jgi:uncharacterized protein (UPF0261 family)
MGRGLGRMLINMVSNGKLHAVISVGGAQGTSISSSAFRELPIGFPKLIVSVIASGNIRPYIGEKDILIMFSIADINGGINQVTETVLTNAASAIIGMVTMGRSMMSISHSRPIVGITTWGTTQKAVTAASDHLKSFGYETVLFHSSGACTSAMEDLVDQGVIDGILDLTTHDVLGEIFQGIDIMPPTRPGRLASAGRAGKPLVVAPGGLSMFVMGPYQDLEQKYRDRPTIKHNPTITEVRVNLDELLKAAEFFAERLNAARGYRAFLMPLKGWNDYDAEGMALYKPEDNQIFFEKLRRQVNPGVDLFEIDSNLNTKDFGYFAAKLIVDHLHK